jgi:hypothetical protein
MARIADKLPAAPAGGGAVRLVEAATVFLQVFTVAEEIGSADCAIRACHRLGFIVKIGKRKIVRLREALHIGERTRIVLGIVRATAKPMPSANNSRASAQAGRSPL